MPFVCADGDGDGDGAENSDDEDWQRQLHFVWEVGGSRVATDVTACTPFPEAHAPFTFPHTGNFTISKHCFTLGYHARTHFTIH